MKIKTFKLCGCDIGYQFDDPSVWSVTGMGRSDPIHGTIHLRRDLDADQAVVTLMHEIIHMVLDMNGFRQQSQDEALVSVLSNTLVAMLRDNPMMVKGWQEVWYINEGGENE
jgi:hypothetical protein